MKRERSIATLVAIALTMGVAFSADPFPRQPAMSTAHTKLGAALVHVQKSKSETPEKHRKAALLNLEQAKSALEQANKNKGSYRPNAIKLIDEATKQLESSSATEKQKEQALALIKEAQEQITKGARTAKD